jgi:hypothetical protein
MKPMLRVALAAALFFVSTSFKPIKKHSPAQKDQYYYWYLDNGTVYEGWNSVAQEITILEDEYGVYVDGDPLDGTLIASGYFVKGYPHLVYASVLLYTH